MQNGIFEEHQIHDLSRVLAIVLHEVVRKLFRQRVDVINFCVSSLPGIISEQNLFQLWCVPVDLEVIL